jgi:RsiW-degrading membrane proteinase PrsW (M82 family)
MDILILLALALAPGVAIGVYIYLKDHHEREPVGLLIRSFFFGVLSIFVTLLISQVIGLFVTIDETSVSDQAVSAFLIVALVEEFSKFIFVRGILYNNKHFNEPFDGIVYSVMVGMGFATFENILYVVDGGIGTALLRMLTAVPAHATFAVLMGYYLGKSKV